MDYSINGLETKRVVLKYDSRIVDFVDRTKATVNILSVQTIIAKKM